MVVGPSYHTPAYDTFGAQHIVAWAVQLIQQHGIQAIAARGLSGLVIAGAIGYAAKVPVFAVRNERDGGHSTTSATGVTPFGVAVERWAFVDDLIETGRTLNTVRRELYAAGLTTTAIPSLILLYSDWNATEMHTVAGVEVPQLRYPSLTVPSLEA
jgi:adenine/guanine phosphoribosyltransferase-like PRPP-binding protein